MADTPQDLLGDPEFQKLSPEAQHIVISKKFPEYAKLSPEAQKIVLSKSASQGTAATSDNPLTPEQMKMVKQMPPSRVGSVMRTGSGSEEDIKSALHQIPLAGGALGGAVGGMPGAALGGGAGEALAQLIDTARTGKPAESPVTDIATQGTLQGVLEGGGQAASWAGGKLAPIASQSLARILKLSPKAFQFGREPAQEVLERGLASGSLKETAASIGEASKQVTSQLNGVLKSSPGTVNIENASLDIANSLPGNAGNRFLKVVDDAAAKLGYRSNQLSSLTNAEANALKQEVARQARFVEGDLKPSIANASKTFGGRIKDGIIKNVPEAGDLLESSANLTEASKGADYAVRAEKAGKGEGGISAMDIKKPSTYLRFATDTITGTKLLFKMAQGLKDSGIPISQALRTAFSVIYPSVSNSREE